MSETRVGIAMNGVTGRMGTNQHLIRSVLAIREQGGVRGPRGTIVLKSTLAVGEPLNLSPVVVNEVTILGSRCGPLNEALVTLANGAVSTDGLVSAVYPLSDGVKAMDAAMRPESLKVLIRP